MKKRILLSGLFLMILLGWMSTGQLFAQNQQSSSGSVNDKVDYVNYMNMLRANPVTGTINPIDVQRAYEQVDQMKATKSAKALNLNWTELGPDNFAGRTRCLLIERNNPSILFAGSTGGGLWKSTSSGTSWSQVDIQSNSPLVISSITQGSDNAIYIATGDANSMFGNIGSGNSNEVSTFYGIGYMGNGIWKSTDLGATFTQLSNTVPVSNDTTSDFMAISKVLVHPANANIIYAATRKAFKMSTDGGNTWITVTDNNGTPLTGKCSDVEAHSDGTVAVAVNGLLYVSNDGSSGSFVKKSTGGFHQLPSATSTRMEIAIAPSNSSYIYVVRVGTNCDIYQCTYKGDTASLIGPGGSLSFNIFGISNANVGWYSMALAVSPSNAGKVYCGGYDLWTWESGTNWVQKSSGTYPYTDPQFVYYYHHSYVFQNSSVMYIATDGGIHKSYDGGSNFMTLNKNYKTAQFFSIAEHANGNVMGGTQGNGTLLFDTTGNTLQTAKLVIGNYESAGSSSYFGTDGGYCSFSLLNPEAVYASGAKHRFARSIDNGANFTSPGDLMSRLYGSTYSLGSYLSPATLWESFNDTYSPDSALYFYNGPDTLLSTLWVKSNVCRDMTFPVSYSDSIHTGDSLYFQDKLTSKMFIGMKDYAFMTRGAHNFLNSPSWWKIAKFNGTSTAIAVSRDGDNCFIGTSNGKLIRVSKLRLATDSLKGDIDKSLTFLIDTMEVYNFGNRAVTSIFVDIHDGNKVLVTLGNYGCNDYVYYSTNALDTINPVAFTSKQGNLPKNPVYTSLIEMNNSNLVLIGTDVGLFATTDISAATPTWTDESGTVPGHVPVFALNQLSNDVNPAAPNSIQYKGYYYDIYNLGSITMATQGRGAFRSNNFVGINHPNNSSTSSENLLMVFPNPTKDNASVAITLKKSSDVILTVYDLQGKRVAGETYKNRQAGNHKFTINVGGLQSGNYLVVVDAESTAKSGKLVIVK